MSLSFIDKKNTKIILSHKKTFFNYSSNAELYFFIANLAISSINKSIIIDCGNSNSPEKISTALNFWSKNINSIRNEQIKYSINYFPEQLADFTSENISRNINKKRSLFLSNIIKNKTGIYVFSHSQLQDSIIGPDVYTKRTISLSTEQNIDSVTLTKNLISLGYQREKYSNSKGDFTLKGDMLEIYPVTYKHPIRIESEWNKITSIYSFNPKTKKKIRTYKNINIKPILLKTHTSSCLKNYLSYFNNFIYLSLDSKLPDSIHAKLSPHNNVNIIASTLPNTSEIILDININSLSPFRGYPSAAKYLRKSNNKTTYIISNKYQTFEKLLNENKIPFTNNTNNKSKKVYLITQKGKIYSYIKGVSIKNGKYLFITDSDFIKNQVKRPKLDTSLLSDLKIKDYIVHEDHGIGVYFGITKKQIDNYNKEYFVIVYDKGDKLFVPIEYASKLSKYIGSPNPKIYKLDGTTWKTISKKIQKDTQKTAKDLLDLYAKREISEGYTFKEKSLEEKLIKSFPYKDTPDQFTAWEEIKADMEKTKNSAPMDRLVCGDVGFGKTELAVRAAFKAITNGKQVALLSPTTILSHQHLDTFNNRLKQFKINIAVLSRFIPKKKQQEIISKISTGKIDLIIGTHRLLSRDIIFKNLGLLIIDEEQRFGVKQKEKLKKFRKNIDILSMSATPIPRTLELSLSGIRNISTITTPPPGRKPVSTIIEPFDNTILKESVTEELKRKGQVFILYNKVKTINIFANKIKEMFPKAKIGIAHGRLPENKLEQIMIDLYNQKLDILVTSTIIESGIDLPNVNTLIVENATQFGLSSLYQLRGRIGRGSREAKAYFFYNSHKLSEKAKLRLKALLEAKELGSGFKLALKDLEIRGSGNILGSEQSGNINTVGLNFYLKILNKTIDELKSGKIKTPDIEPEINLPFSAYIPEDFAPNEKIRLGLYQEISNIDNLDDLDKKYYNLHKKRSSVPKELSNLFELIKLKIIATKAKISEISAKKVSPPGNPEYFKISMYPYPKTDYNKALKLVKKYPIWEVSENNITTKINSFSQKSIVLLQRSLSLLN